jgi:glycosyltransferase involved in cell wall biosynthesis
MSAATVGVVLTTCNYGRFLKDCLRSLDQQTRPADELLIIDDASTDDTVQVLDEVLPTLDIGQRTRVIRSDERRGLAASLNTGFTASSCEMVAHVDADDICLERYLEALAAALVAQPEAGFAYPVLRMTGAETGLYQTFPYDPARLYWMGNFIPNVALVRRSAFDRTPGYRSLPTHIDWDFWLALLEQGIGGVLVEEVLYEWARHPGAMTYQPLLVRLRSRLAVQWRHRALAQRFAREGALWTGRAVLRRVRRSRGDAVLGPSGWVVREPMQLDHRLDDAGRERSS